MISTYIQELRQSLTKQVQHTSLNDGLNVCVLCVTGEREKRESLGDIYIYNIHSSMYTRVCFVCVERDSAAGSWVTHTLGRESARGGAGGDDVQFLTE